MNHTFRQPMGSLEVDVVEVYCAITIGSSGAVASFDGKGVVSVTKESAAGQYTILLDGACNKFLGGSLSLLHSTDSDPASVGVHMRWNSQAVNNATPTVVIQCFAGDDGADANPASGAVIYAMIKMRNSSVA